MVSADVRLTDVIAPDNQNIGLISFCMPESRKQTEQRYENTLARIRSFIETLSDKLTTIDRPYTGYAPRYQAQ